MSLTDDWKAGRLKQGWYFTLTINGEICPNLWFDDEWNDFMGMVDEVLAPCDYDELQRLKEFVNLYSHETEITKQLRQLLKDCKEFFEEENPKDFTVISERMDDLLTRINATIGESEE